MKKYSHAWIAFMAIKRLEVIATTDDPTIVKGVSEDVRKEAKALVKWYPVVAEEKRLALMALQSHSFNSGKYSLLDNT